jgi:hypothetical protein
MKVFLSALWITGCALGFTSLGITIQKNRTAGLPHYSNPITYCSKVEMVTINEAVSKEVDGIWIYLPREKRILKCVSVED